jgi:hypothetical protein
MLAAAALLLIGAAVGGWLMFSGGSDEPDQMAKVEERQPVEQIAKGQNETVHESGEGKPEQENVNEPIPVMEDSKELDTPPSDQTRQQELSKTVKRERFKPGEKQTGKRGDKKIQRKRLAGIPPGKAKSPQVAKRSFKGPVAMFRDGRRMAKYGSKGAPEFNEVAWKLEVDDWVSSSPTIHRGNIYFGSEDGAFYANR